MKEAEVQRAILDLLTAEGIWHERRNTGAVLGTYKGKTRMTRFGKPGVADIFATPTRGRTHLMQIDSARQITHVTIREPFPLWIECKATGQKQTTAQVAFQQEVEYHGHKYLVADSVEVVINWLKAHGVAR